MGDLDASLLFTDVINKATLYSACHDCKALCGESARVDVTVFFSWFYNTHLSEKHRKQSKGRMLVRPRVLALLYFFATKKARRPAWTAAQSSAVAARPTVRSAETAGVPAAASSTPAGKDQESPRQLIARVRGKRSISGICRNFRQNWTNNGRFSKLPYLHPKLALPQSSLSAILLTTL